MALCGDFPEAPSLAESGRTQLSCRLWLVACFPVGRFSDLSRTHLRRAFRRQKKKKKRVLFFSSKSPVLKDSAFTYGVASLYLVTKPYKAVDPRQK